MTPKPVSLREKLALIADQWSPRVVAEMNDLQFKLAKLQGGFVWHSHPETDETFLVLEGELRIDFPGRSVTLKSGEMCVVPKGVSHKPFAEREVHVLLIEPKGTVNTGDAGGARTAPGDVWV